MLQLRTDAFLRGAVLPRRHSASGDNISPAFRWDNAPQETVEYALTLERVSPAGATLEILWAVYRIDGSEVALPEGLPAATQLEDPPGATQACNRPGMAGYIGPLRYDGTGERPQYRFSLYALGRELPERDLDLTEVLELINRHAITRSDLPVGV